MPPRILATTEELFYFEEVVKQLGVEIDLALQSRQKIVLEGVNDWISFLFIWEAEEIYISYLKKYSAIDCAQRLVALWERRKTLCSNNGRGRTFGKLLIDYVERAEKQKQLKRALAKREAFMQMRQGQETFMRRLPEQEGYGGSFKIRREDGPYRVPAEDGPYHMPIIKRVHGLPPLGEMISEAVKRAKRAKREKE